jgi:hypothetical protein
MAWKRVSSVTELAVRNHACHAKVSEPALETANVQPKQQHVCRLHVAVYYKQAV